MKKKSIAALVAVTLLLGCALGGTLAWLTDKTQEVKNVFTTSDIGVTLTESKDLDLKMVPGWKITKDPKATVTSGSEYCYLFVKVDKSTNYDTFMENYEVADGWTELTSAISSDDKSRVFYKEFDKDSTSNKMGTDYYILKENQVKVKDSVTKTMMKELTEQNYPTLTFTAYASQLYKDNNTKFTAEQAWANVNP